MCHPATYIPLVPAAAAHHAHLFVSPGYPGGAVPGCADIITIKTIFHPFPGVAAHIVQAQFVGFFLAHHGGAHDAASPVPAYFIQVVAAGIPVTPALQATPGRILPLGFRGQAVRLAGDQFQDIHEYLRFIPGHVLYRLLLAIKHRMVVLLAHHGDPELLRDGVFTNVKIAHGDFVDGPRPVQCFLVFIAAHAEAAAGDVDHVPGEAGGEGVGEEGARVCQNLNL